MPYTQRRRTLLHSLAVFCALLVFAICVLSAYIRLTQAGLGCDDWPQCYGSRLQPVQAAGATPAPDSLAVRTVRMSHRVIASVALLVVLALVWLTSARSPRRAHEGALAVALLLLALGLALLGRWTAGATAPAVAMGNLLGGALMLALCWRLVVYTGPGKVVRDPRLRVWAGAALVLLLAQMALGGLTSASYAGLSCHGVVDCVQQAQAGSWPWQVLDPWREPRFAVALDSSVGVENRGLKVENVPPHAADGGQELRLGLGVRTRQFIGRHAQRFT